MTYQQLQIVRDFRDRTGCTFIVSNGYVKMANYDLEKAIELWNKDWEKVFIGG